MSQEEIDAMLADVAGKDLAPQPREVCAYFHDHVGLFLQGNLREVFPDATITVGRKTDQGHTLKTIMATAPDAVVDRMAAFCQGFFTCYNKRYQFT